MTEGTTIKVEAYTDEYADGERLTEEYVVNYVSAAGNSEGFVNLLTMYGFLNADKRSVQLGIWETPSGLRPESVYFLMQQYARPPHLLTSTSREALEKAKEAIEFATGSLDDLEIVKRDSPTA